MKYFVLLGILWCADYVSADNHQSYCQDFGKKIICYDAKTGQKTIILKG